MNVAERSSGIVRPKKQKQKNECFQWVCSSINISKLDLPTISPAIAPTLSTPLSCSRQTQSIYRPQGYYKRKAFIALVKESIVTLSSGVCNEVASNHPTLFMLKTSREKTTLALSLMMRLHTCRLNDLALRNHKWSNNISNHTTLRKFTGRGISWIEPSSIHFDYPINKVCTM